MIEENASYPFPVIGPNRLDYPAPSSYLASDWLVSDGKVCFHHTVKGDNLVGELLLEGKAVFACIVVMRASMYRRTIVSEIKNTLECQQTVELEKGYLSREAPKFLPVILYRDCIDDNRTASEELGLDKVWEGKSFTLCNGAIIGRERWFQLFPNPGRLVRFMIVEGLKDGMMRVELIEEDSGYFLAKVSPSIFNGISRSQGETLINHRNSVITHAISMGLSIIANREIEQNSGLLALENIQSVKTKLESMKVPTWEDEEEFDPTYAACSILPIKIDAGVEDIEEE